MSETLSLTAQPRERVGKGAARATRNAGLVPAVIYGGSEAPETIAIDKPQIVRTLNRGRFLSTLFMIDVDGKTTRVIPRDVQFHPVTDMPVHIDFLRLSKDATVDVSVAVHFINEETSPGLKRGGVLNIVRHEVELRVPADAIPEALEADLSGLDINDSVHISAISLPKGVTPTITDRDFTIATIAAPSGGVGGGDEEDGDGEAAEGGSEAGS